MAKLLNFFRKLSPNSDQRVPQKDKQANSRVYLGNLRDCEPRIRRLFELGLPENASKSNFLFPALQPCLPPSKIRSEGQPFPQWKVQRDFQKLRFKHRKRLKQKKIYVMPIGPFPETVMMKIGGLDFSLFELLCEFVTTYYLGFEVLLKDVVHLDELSCTTRIHPGTWKIQVLVKDVLLCLQHILPSDGFAIIGITWEDMYPSDEWNFTLGEASSIDGCAAMCFGRYEPNESQRIYHQNKENNRHPSVSSSNNEQFSSKEGEINGELESCLETSAAAACEVETNEGKENHKHCSRNDEIRDKDRNCVHLDYKLSCIGNSASTLKSSGREKIVKIDSYKVWQFFRVVSHELGHVFGLAHCVYFSCAMNESSTIQEAIDQPLFMCPICLKKIQAAAGFDITERYQKLKKLLEIVHSGLLEMECNSHSMMEREQKSCGLFEGEQKHSSMEEVEQQCNSLNLLELEQKHSNLSELEMEHKSGDLLEMEQTKQSLLEIEPMVSGHSPVDDIGEGNSNECGPTGQTFKDTVVTQDSLEKFTGAIQWLETVLEFLDSDGVH